MKVNKSQSVLFILFLLFQDGLIEKQTIISELEIGDLDFYRYMQEIRAFCTNFNTGIEIVYHRKNGIYYIKKEYITK
ncbi:MAG: hypothetical protein J1F32_07000 [Erysipelotrichales bacterium]|nr:hypothetical protein [Erysipelotrichales bacterium]